jgi:hypothetical protein
VSKIEGINKILSLGFSVSNLSSILNKAGVKQLESKLSQLLCDESLQYLEALIEQKVLAPQNISSILHSAAGATNLRQVELIKTAIKVLYQDIPKINSLISKGFSGENVSAMLHGIGINVGDAINSIYQNADKLLSLSKTNFSLGNIITMIAGAGIDIDKAINSLYYYKDLLKTIEPDLVPKITKACTRSGLDIETKIRSELKKYRDILPKEELVETPQTIYESAKILLSLGDSVVFDRSVETIGAFEE